MKKFLIPASLHRSLLRITILSGLILLLLIGGILAVTFAGGGGMTRGFEQESTFYRLLKEYDFKSRQISEAGADAMRRRELDRFDNDLDRLERNAEGVENWLSVLKRRRQLAKFDPRYEQPYRESARRAALVFPYSEPIAAIAAAALIHNSAITRENEERLREISLLLASSRLASMQLSLHVLLGDFNSPERAMTSLPRSFSAPEYITVSGAETADIFSDLIILKILAGDIPSAAVDIQTALNALPSPAGGLAGSLAVIRLAAEYFYDFGDLLRSAELFSMLPDEAALGRQADALWLAGYTDNARTIWGMQTGEDRSLYNFALTAPTAEEEAALLKLLVERSRSGAVQGTAGNIGKDPARLYGLIHLSRLFDAPQALAILNADKGDTQAAGSADAALIDLEIVKRRTEITELPRMIAETWLLLDHYPDLEYLYHWGIWYFDLQRNYIEAAKLLQIAARHNFDGWWVDMHGGLQQIRDGYLDAAEDMLAEVIAVNGHWAASANMGRVLEARYSSARALTNYEKAMAALIEADPDNAPQIASRMQVRIALCLKSLSRIEESRRALDYALDLNPDNLTARLELSRLE